MAARYIAFITAEKGHQPLAYHYCIDAATSMIQTLDQILPPNVAIEVGVLDMQNGLYVVLGSGQDWEQVLGVILDIEYLKKLPAVH